MMTPVCLRQIGCRKWLASSQRRERRLKAENRISCLGAAAVAEVAAGGTVASAVGVTVGVLEGRSLEPMNTIEGSW